MAHSPKKPDSAEFDEYASGYNAGMEAPLKRLLGTTAEAYIEVKVAWLLKDLRGAFPDDANRTPAILDYGCGKGTLLSVLRQNGFRGALAGCDVSQKMLNEAERAWHSGGIPDLQPIREGRAGFNGEHFDIVVLSSVMHHVEILARNGVYEDVLRVLKPYGRVYVFEHNPFNPITRWVVNRTPIDKNALLLTPSEVISGISAAGAIEARTRYIMFFPPRWRICRPLECLLRRLPFGAQYVVSARKCLGLPQAEGLRP